MDEEDSTFIRILAIDPGHRSPQENAAIFGYLRTIESLNVPCLSSTYRDTELRAISRYARYRRVPGDVLLYHTGEWCDSWFILISGSVLIESSMFLPRACFGTRANGNFYRRNDCLVLEPSDLVVIDYLDNDNLPVSFADTHRQAVAPYKHRHSLDRTPVSISCIASNEISSNSHYSASSHSIISSLNTPSLLSSDQGKHLRRTIKMTQKVDGIDSFKSSHLSDTSSTHSLSSGGIQNDSSHGRSSHLCVSTKSDKRNQKRSNNYPKWCKTGSDTSHCIDSDDEGDDDEDEDDDEDLESSSHESVRDAFWESILKLPVDRTQEDIDLLLENVEQLPAFSNLTKATCRSLCSVMVLAIVREAGQIVLNDNEKLDTWSVVLNGTVEVIELDGTIRELTRGDAFGVRPGKTDRIHRGIMRTVTEDCYFLCVPQTDYVKIMSREGEAEIPEMGEGGRVVLVYETINLDSNFIIDLNKSSNDNAMLKKCRLVTKGTPEKLIEHLIADLSNVDITYPEDFLLTYRTFLDSPRPIVDRLLSWHLHNPKLRPRVNRIILLWVHNHFNDFEDSHEMMKCIEKFDNMLSSDGTAGERRLFRLACSTKARPRQVELAIPLKNSRDLNNSDNKSLGGSGGGSGEQHSNNNCIAINSPIDLPFTIIGGEDGFGVFVHQVYNVTPCNNSDTETCDAIMNQKYLTNPSLSSSLCDSGYPSSPSASSSACVHPYYSSVHNNQIRRADQLISINGRSVEHLKLSEVIQLIHSMINACCSLDNKTGSNSKLIITGTNSSASPSVACNSADIANTNVLNLSKSSTSSSVYDVTFNLRLIVIFNPVQYYQVINSLNTTPTPLTSVKLISKTNSYHTTDDMKSQVKKSSAPSSTVTNNYNDNNEICRLKKYSLPLVTICSPMLTSSNESEYVCHSKNLQSLELSTPTSISIPDNLVITLNDHQHQQQSSTSILLPTKPSLGSFSTANTLSVSPPNNHSLGRRQNFKSLPHASANRPTHSASTSPSRLSHPHEDSQEFYMTTATALASNKQSIPFYSHWSHSTKNPVVIDSQSNINCSYNIPSRPYELHSSTDKLNNSVKTVDHCFTSSLQRSSSQPDLITFNEPLTVGVNEHSTVLTQHHNHYLTNGPDCLSLNSGNNTQNDNLSVIRVWRSSDNGKDHCSKLILLPRRQTNAFEATRLCMEEFGISDEDQNSYCLYHVTVECGPIVKQSRLANSLDDLAGRLTLNSRYYLKNLHNHDLLITDDVAKSILAESRVTFAQLPPEELATRLTIDDYEIFRAVQSTEYIDEVFGLSNSTCINNASSSVTGNSGYATGHENLDRFTDLVNREAYWAPTEICHETNLNRRVDLLKRFIKLAKLCRELRNFNTMFCLLVGLHQTPVERLKQTWDRLPSKYQKIYRDLSMVLDTSRNFHHYRTLISADNVSAPMLPYLPLVLKDLTFIHLGNPSLTPDGLVNFVKLRMLAKEVRVICRMCNVDYDLSSTTHRGRLGGGVGVGRTRTGVNLNAVKAVAAVSSINPKPYFFSPTSSMNNSQTNHNNNCPGTDPNRSEHDMVEVKFNHSNFLDDNKQQREVKLNLDVKSINSSNVSGTNVGYKRFHQHGSSTNSPSSGNFNLGLPTPTSFMIPSSGSGIRRRSNLGLISSSINPKKIYESWLMTLRIRTYLANLKVVQDPKLLSQLSSQLEPSCKDSKTSHPLVSFSVGNTGDTHTTSTTTITTTTNERNDSQQLNIPDLPSANNNTELKGLKLPPENTSTQSVASEPNTSKKSLLKIINISTESPCVSASLSESTTTSNSLPANSTAVLNRPILGAQSVEDARKLLALSESSKRSSQRRLPAFTFPNHHYHNNNNPNTNSIFITPPVGPSAGIGFGQLKSQHNNNSNVSSVGQPHQVHSNPMIQMSNNSIPISSSMPNAIISTCSNHLHHHLHYHQYSHAQNRYPQPARCYFTSACTISSKSLLLDNLIPMPSRITGTTTLVTTNINNNVNINSTSNQIYGVVPNQKHPSHLHPQHPLVHHQKISASPPHNRNQSTKKHQYSNQVVNHQNTNYQYHQQQNLHCKSNYIGPRPTLDPNAAPMLHPACRSISPQQQASFPYWHVSSSGGGSYLTNQQQAAVPPTRFKDQPSLQQRQQQEQHSAPFNSDENYFYPTANTHPLGGPMLSMPRHYQQSTIQRIIPQHLNSKPTRPPPYEIALALKYPQNANLQRVHQSLKNNFMNARNENTNTATNNNNNNNRTSSNLSPECKQVS
ncbi:Rap guanine nucleotide exchange factor 2 isoform 2, partial [Schistosoma japonicum]